MENSKSELYDLKYYISDYITPRLKSFKEMYDPKNGKAPSYPELKKGLSSDENIALWNEILEEMIFPFDYHANPEAYEDMEYDEKELKMKKGLENFAKHFKDLWI